MNDLLSLGKFQEVWNFELADIDRFISGESPRLFQKRISEKVQDRGVDPNALQGLIAFTSQALGFGAVPLFGTLAVATLDAIDQLHAERNAIATEKLLVLRTRPISSVNWDTLTSLIGTIESWAAPLLASRIAKFGEILTLNPANALATERLKLYLEAAQELDVAQRRLKEAANQYQEGYSRQRSTYEAYVANVHEKLKELKLERENLLIDPDTYKTKKRQFVDSLGQPSLTCTYSACVPSCNQIHAENSELCFSHRCFEPGCSNPIARGSHYCKDHGNELADVYPNLPMCKAVVENAPKSKPGGTTVGDQTPTPGVGGTLAIVFGLVLIIVIAISIVGI